MSDIKLTVEPYDPSDRAELLKGDARQGWQRLFENGLTVSDEQILIHSMFAQQQDRDGFRTYDELARRFQDTEREFRSYVAMSEGTIRALSKPRDMKVYTERLGVAVAIIAANEVTQITEADWVKIGETNTSKTLDYEWRASDGERFIRLEAKGSVTEGATTRSNVSDAKKSIREKKETARSGLTAPSVEYGLITLISTGDHRPTIFALDPPGPDEPLDPRRERLLGRLAYFASHLALVSRSKMVTVLRNRRNAIASLSDFDELDGLVLERSEGERFYLSRTFGNRPLVELDGVVGRVLRPRRRPWDDDRPPYARFVGFERDLFEILVRQDFDEILAYRAARRRRKMNVDLRSESGEPVGAMADFVVNTAGIAFGAVTPSTFAEDW